jgi:hypothetical protein
MNKTLRSLIVTAGVAVLATSSQAVITFSNYNSQFTFDPSTPNQLSPTPPQLSNVVFGTGPVTDTGSFDVASTAGIAELDVNEVDGFAVDGNLSLTVTVYNGATISSGVLENLYSSSIDSPTNSLDFNTLVPTFQDNFFSPILLTGTHAVSYTATFNGYDASAMGYLGGLAIDAYEPVPEPSAYAVLGLGVIGLLIRRRRSVK